MRAHEFWKHWKISENPFHAEEARDDAVFMRMQTEASTHPDFAKVYGSPAHPTAAVVFGEKGSGKTALRLTMENRYAAHNGDRTSGRVWVVHYDDFNGMLDACAERTRAGNALEGLTLDDHQDAVLSEAVTQLVDAILGEAKDVPGFERVRRVLGRMPRHLRASLCLLAALYDQPHQGRSEERFVRLRRKLRLDPHTRAAAVLGGVLCVIAGLLALFGRSIPIPGWQLHALLWANALGGALVLIRACAGSLGAYRTALRVRRSLRAVRHSLGELAARLQFRGRPGIAEGVLPVAGSHDSRYRLTHRLLDVLAPFGYTGMVVLVDCVDEPATINGDTDKMRALVWPMLHNKFLQQERVGIKLLLPIELRYLVHRESEAFFKEARLDKQNMVDRLAWSGAALYDLANQRLSACREDPTKPIALCDLFEDGVSAQDVADALDQMQQPRDAFKFLYQVVHDHCASTQAEQPSWQIQRLTLTQVARTQSRRLTEMQRGLQPA